MPDRNTIIERVTLTLIVLIGVWLSVAMTAHLFRDSSMVGTWGQSGDYETSWQDADHDDPESTADPDTVAQVFREVEPDEFYGGRVPAVGDTLLTVDGLRATDPTLDSLFHRALPQEHNASIQYRHLGRDFTVTLFAQPVERSEFVMMLGMHILRFLIGYAFLVVGFIALRHLTASVGVRSLVLFTFAMAGFAIQGVSYLEEYYITVLEELPPVLLTWPSIMIVFLSGFWLNLNFEFPHRTRFMQRYPWAGYLIAYLPAVVAVLLGRIAADGSTLETVSTVIGTLALFLQITAGMILLAYHNHKAHNALEKRQTKLVLMGAGLAFTPLLVLMLVQLIYAQLTDQNLLDNLSLQWALLLVNLILLGLLAMPVTLLYAFTRYGLLDVEAKLRRGTRHALITAGVLAAFFFIVYSIGDLLLSQLNIESRTPTILLAMVLTLGVHPAQRWLTEVIERRFFPARHQLKAMLDDLTERLTSFPDRDTLWKQIGTRLRHAVGVERVLPLMREADECFHLQGGEVSPFSMRDELIKRLEQERRPIVLDEAMASLRVPFTDGQIRWISEHRVNLVLPLFVRGRLVGFVALGRSTRGQDYTPEIVQVLHSVMQHVALSTDNLRLLEDNLQKKRLEEELRLARSIQEGFLPQDIPDTPGLDIGARSRFSLEVAGDYFDVIALPDGRTVIALGDVSGKGAGAALIMANLQASLRALVKVDADLTRVVSSVNDIICQNTPTEEYITFVMGQFDPRTSQFTYVNAGHNPPLVFGDGGAPRELNTGGLILGVVPGAPYEAETITLKPGERVFLYTDGITEAMNSAGDEFGEERLMALLSQHNGTPCGEVVKKLEEEVLRFHGKPNLEDDCTMILARATGKAVTAAADLELEGQE